MNYLEKSIICVLLVGLFTACGNPVKTEVEEIEKLMPLSTKLGTIIGISYNDSDTACTKMFMLGKDGIFPDVLASNLPVAKSNLSALLCDSLFHTFLSTLVEEDMGLYIHIKGSCALNSNELTECELYLSPDEISEINKRDWDFDWETILYLASYKNYVWAHESMNSNSKMSPVSMTIDEKNKTVKYKFIMDDCYFKGDLLRYNLENNKKKDNLLWFLLRLANNSAVHQKFADYGYGINMVFEDTNATHNLTKTINNEELKKLISNKENLKL